MHTLDEIKTESEKLEALGANPVKMRTILYLHHYDIFPMENENAREFIARVRHACPGVLENIFENMNVASEALADELTEFNNVLHLIRIDKGIHARPLPPNAMAILVAAKRTGVRVTSEDTGETFLQRVQSEAPGYMAPLATTPFNLPEKVDVSLKLFREKVNKSRVLLLFSLLLMTANLFLLVLFSEYGTPNPEFEDMSILILKANSLLGAFNILWCLKHRVFYARYEESPKYL